ncbi:MAG TPA: trypsin-like peptidase domain-containing protein, partial [Myxococcota bacterium]|nr:trypsin-like peptidase domain-containing protein [Myxococcota bacterium]
AIGHPGGGGLWTLTTGTVSSKRRDQARDIFQTDTAINPGNSGGPLLDEHARLVGVNTFVRRVNDQGLPLEGLNYSLRSRLALDWVNRQGVTRVAAISRSAADSAPAQPAPRAEPVPEPAPSRPEPSAPPPSGERAERESQREPTPPVVRSEPERRREEPPPPSRDEEPREFEGPDGETMYGVPNPEVDLDEALLYAREGFQKLMERADESVQEMDRLFDDYEDF